MSARRVACHTCDLLIELPTLVAGDEARCPRCSHVVAWQGHGGLRASLAFLVAAMVMYIIAMSFPFLAFESRGFSREIALWQVASELFAEGMPLVGIGVGVLVIGVPGVLLLIHLAILTSVLSSLKMRPLSVMLLRWSSHLSPWNMVEIFAVGTLASLTKVASLATVVFGVSFWAYLAFTVLLTISLLHFDRRRLWALVKVPGEQAVSHGRVQQVEVLL